MTVLFVGIRLSNLLEKPGASGVLGSAVRKAFKSSDGFEILSLSYSQSGDGLVPLNLTSNEEVDKVFKEFKPDCESVAVLLEDVE